MNYESDMVKEWRIHHRHVVAAEGAKAGRETGFGVQKKSRIEQEGRAERQHPVGLLARCRTRQVRLS
jgi:hypothetical protein